MDNIDFREQLRELEPETIGGEMEGAGLYAACQDNHVDWILVKAICDWAGGNKAQNKDEYQRLAADNAARFVLYALNLVSSGDEFANPALSSIRKQPCLSKFHFGWLVRYWQDSDSYRICLSLFL